MNICLDDVNVNILQLNIWKILKHSEKKVENKQIWFFNITFIQIPSLEENIGVAYSILQKTQSKLFNFKLKVDDFSDGLIVKWINSVNNRLIEWMTG